MRTLSLGLGVLLSLVYADRAFAQQLAPQQVVSPDEAPSPPVQEIPPVPVEAAPLPPAPTRVAVAAPTDAVATTQEERTDFEELPLVEAPLGLAGRLAVGATVDVLWYLDTAHDAFSVAKGTAAGGLAASFTLLDFGHGWLLDVGAGWHLESSTAALFQSIRAAYDANTGYLDSSLRFELAPWFAPRARVSVGVQYLSASLTPDDGSTPLEGGALSFVTSLGAGFELLARIGEGITSRRAKTAAVALSLVVEGGFVLGTNAPLTVTPREPKDDEVLADRLPVIGTAIGSLGGLAPYLRIAGVVRF